MSFHATSLCRLVWMWFSMSLENLSVIIWRANAIRAIRKSVGEIYFITLE